MTKILVVDDEPDLESLIRQKFRKEIREQVYHFDFAHNGKIALSMLKDLGNIDVVISDINMPEMDGLTLVTHIKHEYPLLKTVIVSAYGDISNIRSAMNKGAFDFLTKPVNFEDFQLTLEKTIAYVEQIKKTLQAIKENNILKMYVDESVLEFMAGKEYEQSLLANETIDATVVFIDIAGFTTIAENETADTVVHMLNSYFDIISSEIIAHGGYIDKFIGDEVMAVFKQDFHRDKSIEASLAVINKIKSEQVLKKLKYHPNVAIGLNSGEVISGNIGSANIKRLDFTVIGDVVNTAKRLQSIAREGEIIIADGLYHKVKDSFKFERVGDVILKNKSKPMTAYRVLS